MTKLSIIKQSNDPTTMNGRVSRRKRQTIKHRMLKHQGSSPLERESKYLCSVSIVRLNLFIPFNSWHANTIFPQNLSQASRIQEIWPDKASELCNFPQDSDAATQSVRWGFARTSSRGKKLVCNLIQITWASFLSMLLTIMPSNWWYESINHHESHRWFENASRAKEMASSKERH